MDGYIIRSCWLKWPLPSDPDPNFPFRKHLDKNIVPNPRKAFQRIIRGETKAERRIRKEQDEIKRLLNSGGHLPTEQKQQDTGQSHSKDWEEFQQLTARIEHTVQESVSKVQAVKAELDELEFITAQEEEQPTDNWADFSNVPRVNAEATEASEFERIIRQGANPDTVVESDSFPELTSKTISENWADFSKAFSSNGTSKVEEQFSDRLRGSNSKAQASEGELIAKEDPSAGNWANFNNAFESNVNTQKEVPTTNQLYGYHSTQLDSGIVQANSTDNWADFSRVYGDDSKTTEINQKSITEQVEPLNHTVFGTLLDLDSNSQIEDNHSQPASKTELSEIKAEENYQISDPVNQEKLFKQEVTEDIDTFLGIEAIDYILSPEPIISDPLQLLEKLKPKQEDNPFADLGMDVSSGENPVSTEGLKIGLEADPITQVGEKTDVEHSQPTQQIIASSDGAQSFEVKEQTLREDSSTSAHLESVDNNGDPTVIDSNPESNQVVLHEPIKVTTSVELAHDTSLNNSFCSSPKPVREPLVHEINVDENPFGTDDFGIQPTNAYCSNSDTMLINNCSTKSEENKVVVRPRGRPTRQETLSGNNPFRRRSSDETSDELTRAVAGIDLLSTVEDGYKRRDSFESSGSSIAEERVNESMDVNKDETLGQTEPNLTSGFDPLQTIYPDSDNESVTPEVSNLNQIEPANSVTLNEKPLKDNDSNEPDLLLDTTKSPAYEEKNISNLVPAENKRPAPDSYIDESNLAVKTETPTGWVDFGGEIMEEEIDRPVIVADQTSGAEWFTTPPQAVPREPEPPRPDTPDLELDKPFYLPVEDDAFYRLWLRYPEKKTRVKQLSKYTTDRYWREVAICFSEEQGRKLINIHEVDEKTDSITPEPYRTIRIEPYMQLSREKLQQYDKYGKLHVFKLNHVSYREIVGIRPEKFSIKNLQHLVSHKPKQNVAIDHLPVYTEILKFGSLDQAKIRKLMPVFEDALMRIPAHKDSSLLYSREEVCCYVTDEYIAKVSSNGSILEQKARTRIQCTAFVNGGPHIVLGLNDKWRFGREVVRRSDILPVMHDEWISIRKPEFHSCVEMDAYEKDHMLKFYPLDGCRFELLRFRTSLRGNRELPLQLKTTYSIDGRKVYMRCELLVPGFFSASHRSGAVPCENVEIHIPVPEEWIYHFRVEKHHKYGSVHSTLRKPGRIKGLERITQMAQSLLPASILEASIGLAKYEHLYKAVVWRIPRVPDKSEASFKPHLLTCKLLLAPHDVVPEWNTLVPECQVEYTMPSSTVSGTTVRSISVETTGVAEKFVKYLSKYRYTVDIDYQLGVRKEPGIKSVLDEPEDKDEFPETTLTVEPVEHNTEEVTDEITPTNGLEVADLLGLGEEFSGCKETKTAVSTNQVESTSGDVLDLI